MFHSSVCWSQEIQHWPLFAHDLNAAQRGPLRHAPSRAVSVCEARGASGEREPGCYVCAGMETIKRDCRAAEFADKNS